MNNIENHLPVLKVKGQQSDQIAEAKLIVEQLHNMLHRDALHRTELFQKYAHDPDVARWSPDLNQQCELIENHLSVLKVKEQQSDQIAEAKLIVEQLHNMLHRDALHRTELFRKYANDPNVASWSPDLHLQCELVEALRRKLSNIT